MSNGYDVAVSSKDKEEETSSEAQALADILAWSENCPTWQRDALRRLCTKDDKLDQKEIDELMALCKSKGGVVLAAGDISDPETVTTDVHLKAIHGVENVNALKPGERLTFDKSGLTVVYGDNGSGKSGYARILKKACRARTSPEDDKIRENIYATGTGPQKAVIDFSANGHNKSENWTADNPGDPLLSSVSVFDSRTANVHVDMANDVAYTPFPMRVLRRLAEACEEIKNRIDTEINELEQQTPAAIAEPECHDDTAVGKLIAGLNGETKEQEVRDLAKLDGQDEARLDILKTDLVHNNAKVARQVEGQKTRLNTINTAFVALQSAVSDAQIHRLAGLYQAYRTAQDTARVTSCKLFADEPLQDIGSDVWRTLWEAARTYSEQQAYPNLPFPVTVDGARCVLCQQELDAESTDRFARFEGFVKDETKRKEEQAAAAYQAALNELNDADVPSSKLPMSIALIRDELSDTELTESVRRAAVMMKWRLRAIRRSHPMGDAAEPLPIAKAWPTDGVAKHDTELSERIIALRAEDQSEERKNMRAELEELEDRVRLVMIQEDVIAEIARRKKRAALKAVRKDTTTNRITTKSDEIAERLVTNTLRAQFAKEIDKFGVAGLAVERRKDQVSYGVPYFRVSLIRKPDVRASEILSEGEHRCVALAAFLSELAVTKGRSAIVFDDPVSSLDHLHREAVAERLADEGQHRQIIVLTHDIAFLLMLDQTCCKKKTPLAFRSVTRAADYAGICQKDLPARAQSIEKFIKGMQKQLDNEKILHEKGDNVGWEKTVDTLYKRLRVAWELAVEESVGPVIKRLSNKVETKGLAKVTILTMKDCTEMRSAYGRCSIVLHSFADALNSPLSSPEDVQNEIDALRTWVMSIKERQNNIH